MRCLPHARSVDRSVLSGIYVKIEAAKRRVTRRGVKMVQLGHRADVRLELDPVEAFDRVIRIGFRKDELPAVRDAVEHPGAGADVTRLLWDFDLHRWIGGRRYDVPINGSVKGLFGQRYGRTGCADGYNRENPPQDHSSVFRDKGGRGPRGHRVEDAKPPG